MVFAVTLAVSGQSPTPTSPSSPVLTNIFQIWTMPRREGGLPYRVKTEAVVYFCSSEYGCAWGECRGQPTWLPIADCGTPLTAGQRIAIDGVLLPGQDRFDWSKSQIQVLEEGVALKPETVFSLSANPTELDKHLVQVDGVIATKSEHPDRLELGVQIRDVLAAVRVLKPKDTPETSLKPGDRVRLKAVYAPHMEKNGGVSEYNLWVARVEDIERVRGSEPAPLSADLDTTILTNIYQIWTLPYEERHQLHRMRTELVIYFYDAEWQNAWGECQGRPAYLPIADCPVPLKAGQRVLLDGVVAPIRERFVWDKTQVRILEDKVPLNAEPVLNLYENPTELKGHIILVEGLIDRLLEDSTHVTLTFLADNAAAKAYAIKDPGQSQLHFQAGDFVRMKCVYSPQLDVNGRIGDLSLFVPQPSDIEVIGSLNADRRFARARTPIVTIQDQTSTNSLILVAGEVRSHEPGRWVTLWDDTGQIMVESRQIQPLRFGDFVEAVGYPYIAGVNQCLRGGLYRISAATNRPSWSTASVTSDAPLRLAERVRELSSQDTVRRLPVTLHAIVTWSHPETPFAYVEDSSGGIRVVNPNWGQADARKPGTIVEVSGETGEGDFVPVITNATISRVGGFWNLEEGRLVTLEQALTGVEDGRWVQMRGYVRQATHLRGLVRLDLSTAGGEFEAWTPATQSFDTWRGSSVRVHGVCSAAANARHQLTGIQLWVPEVKYLQVEEPAPYDLFAVPSRPLSALRRFNAQNAVNRRVRTFGTVTLHVPGSYLYVQQGPDSVLVMSQQPDPLRPGDRIEVVGFPGNEGRRFLLREAVYRRVAAGGGLTATPLSDAQAVNLDLEGLLARAEGVLLNQVNQESEVRLLIRTRNSTFEASLNPGTAGAAKRLPDLALDSRVAVTGVYQAQSDEYGNPRSFLLRLRSGDDVRVLQEPPWWNLARLLRVLVAVLVVSLFALFWGVVLSRKNALLRQAQTELQAAHNKLELRVQERTRELQERTLQLQEQVTAKERAREELAEAQRRLMLASRQAGMAEVATGVLHNVGNVLNSVNISATLVRDKVNQSQNVNLDKVLALLHEHQNDLGRFFDRDPKGRKLLEYLEVVNRHLGAQKNMVHHELDTLSQNIEHIKEIVAMQQSYAQSSGVLEVLEPAELVEDAIRMHAAAYERHSVKVIREFAQVPACIVDRHKALQILANLLHNAKYACEENPPNDRRVTVRLDRTGPDRIRIEVADNGMGISAENLTRIFSFGFTTRRNGHGFGLHSGALAAKEMGGSLCASSDGPGQGASFVLELPLRSPVSSDAAA